MLIIANMSTNIIVTDIESIPSKVQWFVNTLKTASENGIKIERSGIDPAALAELLTMMKKSRSCNHISNSNTNLYAHERVPTNWSEIPTAVEQMQLGFSAMVNVKMNLRMNDTICTLLSGIMCIIETAMAYEKGLNTNINIVYSNVNSGRHMGISKIVFDVLSEIVFDPKSVSIHLCLAENLYRIATTVLSKRRNVNVYKSMDWHTMLSKIRSMDKICTVVVVLNEPSCPDEVIDLIKTKNVLVSVNSYMCNPETTMSIATALRESNMVMEMALMANPYASMVRIRSAIWNTNSSMNRIMFRHPIEYTTGMVSALTNKIRPINLMRMCFDCRMAYMIAKALLSMMKDESPSTNDEESLDWAESFAETVTIDLTEYTNPL